MKRRRGIVVGTELERPEAPLVADNRGAFNADRFFEVLITSSVSSPSLLASCLIAAVLVKTV